MAPIAVGDKITDGTLMYLDDNNEAQRFKLYEELKGTKLTEVRTQHLEGMDTGQKQGASPAKSDINSNQSKESPGSGHKRSNLVDIRKMQNLFKNAAEDTVKSIRSYVTELKERVAKLLYQKQLLVCQAFEEDFVALRQRLPAQPLASP